MRRRDVIKIIGGLVVAMPHTVAARQPKIPLIGYLALVPPTAIPGALQSFHDELRHRGFVEGQNIRIEYRWAAEMNKSVAAELVALNPDVIVAFATPPASAAREATSKIPIVMVGIADPIGAGLIASLSRPGGNVTGTTALARDLGGKLLEILREVVPNINPVFLLLNPQNPASSLQLGDIEVAARSLGLQLVRVEARGPDEIDAAFARMTRESAKGVITIVEPLFIDQRARIADLAQKARLPTVFLRRENVQAGGLISYGPSLPGQFRDTAIFVDKILKGAKPSELPVEQPTRLELIINLKTAKAIGISIPPSVLARADEVIE